MTPITGWLLISVVLAAQAAATEGQAPLSPYADNPRYLARGEVPVFPLGATHQHSWTPISRPQVDLLRDLDRLAEVMERIDSPHVVGFVRCLPYDPWNHPHDGLVEVVLQPWKQVGDGRYDLEQFEPRWEARLERFLSAALERNVVVSLEVWDDWSVTRGPGGAYDPGPGHGWNNHAFHPDNNVNYGRSVLAETTRRCDAPFYQTIPSRDDNRPVLRLQQRYVSRLVDLAGRYPNVIWNLSNESRASLQWSRYWAEFLRERLPAGRLIGEMPSTNRRDGGGECDPDLNAHMLALDDRYDVVDVAQGVSRHEFGEEADRQAFGGGERIREVQIRMQEAGRVKPQIVSKDYTNRPGAGTTVLWGRFTGGAAAARFHRPSEEQGAPISDFQYQAVERLGRFLAGVEFWTMEPQPDLIARLARESPGANVLGRRGREYIIQLVGGEGRLEINLEPGRWRTWMYAPVEDAYVGQGGKQGHVVHVTDAPLPLAIPGYQETLIVRLRAAASED